MERNHLSPQQVLSRGDTGWDGYCVYAAVVDDLGCSPVASVVTILLNLEPGRALRVSSTDIRLSTPVCMFE